MKRPPTEWRINVAAIIMDAAGKILVGCTSPTGRYWHFPQGGVSKHESLIQAIQREVLEEVGLSPSSYSITCSLGGFRYRYPEKNEKSARWRGQEQTYYLLQCHQEQPPIDISRTEEFERTEWVHWKELKASMFANFKRPIIEQVLAAFFPSSLPAKGLHKHLSSNFSPRRYLTPTGHEIKLDTIDASEHSLFAGSKEIARSQIEQLQEDISSLHAALCAKQKGQLLLIFHGLDGSGCDASVRHLAACMDPFALRVESLIETRCHEMHEGDFLRPLHARCPRVGETVLFDRSLYYMLAHEYLHEQLDKAKLQKRMKYLTQFEAMLSDEGTHIIKIYLHISEEEQQRRFEKRRINPARRPRLEEYSVSYEHNWAEEQELYSYLLTVSNSKKNPWYVLPADRKWYRDLCVMRIVAETLQNMLLSTEEAQA